MSQHHLHIISTRGGGKEKEREGGRRDNLPSLSSPPPFLSFTLSSSFPFLLFSSPLSLPPLSTPSFLSPSPPPLPSSSLLFLLLSSSLPLPLPLPLFSTPLPLLILLLSSLPVRSRPSYPPAYLTFVKVAPVTTPTPPENGVDKSYPNRAPF